MPLNRQYQLSISGASGGQIIEATSERHHMMRIMFKITHEWGGNRSLADIAIYGLSKATEGRLYKKYDKIDLIAGYAESMGLIFKGEIKNVVKERNGPERITRIYALSDSLSREKAVIAKTAGEGATIVTIIKLCAQSIGLPLQMNDGDFADEPNYPRGKPLMGNPVMILRGLSKTHSFNFTLESGRILIVKKGKSRKGKPILISQLTGMIGSPEVTILGANVSVNLDPSINLGSRFEIDSRTPQILLSGILYQNIEQRIDVGIYTVGSIEHNGDSHSDKWETKIEGWRFAA